MDQRSVETTLYSLTNAVPLPAERRRGERYLSLLRVGALTVGGRRELCLIRNISGGGMLIRAYSPIPPGTPLSVELKHGEQVHGIAQWSKDGATGVEFDRPIDIFALLRSASEGPRPRMPRIELDCTAWLRAGASTQRVRTLNVSQGGLCVRAEAPPADGAKVVVSLPGLSPVPGQVVWAENDSCGIAFNRLIALGDLMAWLQDRGCDPAERAAG